MTIATSSSVSFSWSRMPVKKAILPPGMQKALICLLPIRLTSHFQLAARSFHWAAKGMMRAAMARRRCSCALPVAAPARPWPWPAPAARRTAARRPAPRSRPAPGCAPSTTCPPPPAPAPAWPPPAAAASRKARRARQGRSEVKRSADTCGNNKRRPNQTAFMPATPRRPDLPPPCPGAMRSRCTSNPPPCACSRWASPPACRCCWCWARSASGCARRASTARTIGYLSWVGPGLRLQVGVGAAGGPAAAAAADHAARAAARLAAAGAGDGDRGPGRHGASTIRAHGLEPLIWCALLVAFGSATQDIALDAFRIESAETASRRRWRPPTRPATAWR